MNDDLIALAGTLAEAGHLPGIRWESCAVQQLRVEVNHVWRAATEADIHLACHNAIVAKGWQYMPCPSLMQTYLNTEDGKSAAFASLGTTTLSLLRAFAAALEAR